MNDPHDQNDQNDRDDPAYRSGALTVHSAPDQLRAITRTLRAAGRRITLVPTLGALHEGHRELIRRARRIPNTVTVVSIFVNPLQFGRGEDLDRYPRPFDADLAICREHGVELVFAPGPEQMYADDAEITIDPGRLGTELEGAARPGHFAGVLTVVAKLCNIVGPDYAFFGEKDYQQLILVGRMVDELNLGVRVIRVPTVRDADGLALSSRNAYLTTEQRAAAVAIPAALTAGVAAGRAGGDAAAVLAAARAVLAAAPLVRVDYLELRDPALGAPPERGEARLLIAAVVGGTRLIDNIAVTLGALDDPSPGDDQVH